MSTKFPQLHTRQARKYPQSVRAYWRSELRRQAEDAARRDRGAFMRYMK
jgi:hypothetical protein